MAFPLIKLKNGEYITMVKSTTFGSTAGVIYELPGNTSATIYNSTTSIDAGRLQYKFTAAASTTTLTAINMTGSLGVALQSAPALLIYEEQAKDYSNNDVKDAILLTVADGSGTNTDVTIQPPVMTAGVQGSAAMQSDNSVTIYGDRYGANVVYDSDSQGLATVLYPDDQAAAMVGAGSDPKLSASGAGGTYDSAVKIKNPVAKFDNEVSTASLTADLILIGGPCANSLVATLLSSESTTCSSDANGFITKYPNGLIKEVTNAFSSGHKALIVAGTNGAGTRALAAKVMAGTLAFQ
jgi:hypothetical protein